MHNGSLTTKIYVKEQTLSHKKSEEIYESAYKNGQSNAPSWVAAYEERRALVELAVRHFAATGSPLRALDIGCGTGVTTSWIGEIEGNYWVGIDTVDQETLKLHVPRHGTFLQGNFLDDTFVSQQTALQGTFDLIVDHGAIATSLQQSNELAHYLVRVAGHLKIRGVFALLTACNPEGVAYNEALPDGRQRRFFAPSDFAAEPFRKHFDLEHTQVITYAPSNPQNPYSKLENNDRPISIVHAILRKR
jgi:SAM-dependent methyltransferase